MKLARILAVLALTLSVAAVQAVAQNKEGSDHKGSVAEAFDAPEKATSLPVGSTIPDVTVQDADGEDVSLRKLVAKQKTALIYYRGGWCPFCNKHLKEVQEVKDQITEAGYQIVAISADRPEKVRAAVDKGQLDYALLSDSAMAGARAFRIAFVVDETTRDRYKKMINVDFMDTQGKAHNSLPVPAFYLIDTDGKITFEFHDPDYKVRLSKEKILGAIR